MSTLLRTALCTALLCLLNSCQPSAPMIVSNDISPGIGPFDSRGRYREDWADDPSKWRRPSAPPPVANVSPVTSSGSSSTASTPPPSKPTPKPSVTRHTVKRGDTLSHIARRYGSSVSAIRRANGISGSLIFPGQKLIVPRR
ncbi:MAG: LysM peptidoglycan-binding domain-containing protein [Luteolibacter sp.]